MIKYISDSDIDIFTEKYNNLKGKTIIGLPIYGNGLWTVFYYE